ncbi:MAG TPA: GH92 family glycosyl hydrolase [Verrucomicrobiae bacterium]
MKFRNLLAVVTGAFSLTTPLWAQPNPVDEPLPMVGTDAHGHAYPGATVPFGMVQLSPDTPLQGWDGSSGYHYSDSVILGFSHTHLSGTGCGCLGDVLLMPTVGAVTLDAGTPGNGYASSFSHDQEHATPGYYSVFLKDPKVTAELTATERCGLHKYTFPATDDAHIILDLDHNVGNDTTDAEIDFENSTTISGHRYSNGWGGRRAIYFVMQFSKPFDAYGIERNGEREDTTVSHTRGRKLKAYVNFKTTANEAILVKVGISGTGVEGARKNLAAEISGWDFDAVRAAAVSQWQKVFDAVQVDTFDPHIRTTFYANLYLSALGPVLYNDVDGTYRGMDHKNHPGSFANYSTFSIWDIYRAEWPLLELLHPDRVDDMVQSLLTEYKEYGQHTTPIWPLWGNETWCMIGYHSVDMIADAYAKGFTGFDNDIAYAAMRDTAMQERNGLSTYKTLGYVASKAGDAATSKTIEYSFDDWCLARAAAAMGHADDAKLFYQRSANYRNLFDSTVGFFRGRKAAGNWRTPFVTNGLVGDEYTEADAWQYAFAVQQDVPGMISLYGGDDGFITKLDSLFTQDSYINTGIPDISGLIGQYSQGDEQCHHVAYLYDYAGAPYKTQQHVRQAMSLMYNDTPSGQCGNVDCGQMAAWYVFSALGFYPVNPNSGVYIIGSPVVNKAVVHLDGKKYGGNTFTVIADNNSAENVYIQSATLNDQPFTKTYLTQEQLTGGGTLHLVMGAKPNPAWGIAPADRPPATMPEDFKYQPLPAASTTNLVTLPLPIRVICGSDEPAGSFVPYPNVVNGSMAHADADVDTSATHAAPLAVYQNEFYGRDYAYTFPVPKDGTYVVRLHFAEIFDNAANIRVENVFLNGNQVLTNFDIFTAAEGVNKAVVEEFTNIAPDAQGNLVVRIAAASDSQDQNAKICGIEILTPKQAAEVDTNTSGNVFTTKTADGKTSITFDTTAAPDLNDWAQTKLAPVLAEEYPKIVALLPSEGYTAPRKFKITIRPMAGVAYTTGTRVVASAAWLRSELKGEAVGSLVHECVHVVQQYGHYNDGEAPGWIVEGMADYYRWFKYEPQSHGADLVWLRRTHSTPRYDGSYRISANFLNWVSEKYDAQIVPKLNAAMRDGNYHDTLWKEATGKTVQELGAEWKKDVQAQLAAPKN